MQVPTDAWRSRRRMLQTIGVAGGAGLLTAFRASGTASTDDLAFVLRQGDTCVQIEPLSGEKRMEEFYDYTYPTDEYDGPPGSEGRTFSSEGTTHLQRDNTSILFLYEGPDGLSLVVVHGHVGGDADRGGAVSFTLSGMPTDGEWVVRDDYYLTSDGEQADSNWDQWDVDGDVHDVDWLYAPGRTDGGAFRGLGSEFEIAIDAAFGDEAALGEDHSYGPIETWEVLSAADDGVHRHELDPERELIVERGHCDASDDAADPDDGKKRNGEGDDKQAKANEEEPVVLTEDLDGNVETDGSVLIRTDVDVDGNVEAGGDVSIGPDGEIDGNVEAGGSVEIGPDGEVDGNVKAAGDVSVGPDGEIDGNVEAEGDVSVRPNGEIDGKVEAGGNVSIDPNGEVDGNVEAGETVSLSPNAEIDGDVTGKSVDVAVGAEIDGIVSS